MNRSCVIATVGVIIFSIIIPVAKAEDNSKIFVAKPSDNSKPLKISEVELYGHGQDEDLFGKSCKFKLYFPTHEQWIEIYNPTNLVIDPAGDILIGLANTTKAPHNVTALAHTDGVTWAVFEDTSAVQPGYSVIELGGGFPHANATIVLGDGNGKILDSTPPLSDTFNDSRTWQRIDGKWIFKESTPCAPVPEFSSIVFLILPASIAGTLIITKVRKLNIM